MKKDNKNMLDEQTSDMADKTPLSEQELEGASGGFTLIDMCQNSWSPLICLAIWGGCSHLQMKETGRTIGNQKNQIHYLVSCDKGCFKDVAYNDYISD